MSSRMEVSDNVVGRNENATVGDERRSLPTNRETKQEEIPLEVIGNARKTRKITGANFGRFSLTVPPSTGYKDLVPNIINDTLLANHKLHSPESNSVIELSNVKFEAYCPSTGNEVLGQKFPPNCGLQDRNPPPLSIEVCTPRNKLSQTIQNYASIGKTGNVKPNTARIGSTGRNGNIYATGHTIENATGNTIESPPDSLHSHNGENETKHFPTQLPPTFDASFAYKSEDRMFVEQQTCCYDCLLDIHDNIPVWGEYLDNFYFHWRQIMGPKSIRHLSPYRLVFRSLEQLPTQQNRAVNMARPFVPPWVLRPVLKQLDELRIIFEPSYVPVSFECLIATFVRKYKRGVQSMNLSDAERSLNNASNRGGRETNCYLGNSNRANIIDSKFREPLQSTEADLLPAKRRPHYSRASESGSQNMLHEFSNGQVNYTVVCTNNSEDQTVKMVPVCNEHSQSSDPAELTDSKEDDGAQRLKKKRGRKKLQGKLVHSSSKEGGETTSEAVRTIRGKIGPRVAGNVLREENHYAEENSYCNNNTDNYVSKEIGRPLQGGGQNNTQECAVKTAVGTKNTGNASVKSENIEGPKYIHRKGVYYDTTRRLWRANWKEGGRVRTKGFAVTDLGWEGARVKAIQLREEKENSFYNKDNHRSGQTCHTDDRSAAKTTSYVQNNDSVNIYHSENIQSNENIQENNKNYLRDNSAVPFSHIKLSEEIGDEASQTSSNKMARQKISEKVPGGAEITAEMSHRRSRQMCEVSQEIPRQIYEKVSMEIPNEMCENAGRERGLGEEVRASCHEAIFESPGTVNSRASEVPPNNYQQSQSLNLAAEKVMRQLDLPLSSSFLASMTEKTGKDWSQASTLCPNSDGPPNIDSISQNINGMPNRSHNTFNSITDDSKRTKIAKNICTIILPPVHTRSLTSTTPVWSTPSQSDLGVIEA